MKASITRRWSDSFWTLVRFLCCLGTTAAFATMFYSTFPNHGDEGTRFENLQVETDPYLVELQHTREHLFLMPIAMGMLIFSGLQLVARSPFHKPQMMHWLGIHGWDGSEFQLPHRRAVPLTEILCVAAVTLLCGVVSRTGFLLIPWAWLVARAILQTPGFLSGGLNECVTFQQPGRTDHCRAAGNWPMHWLASCSTEWKVGLLWSLTGAAILWLEQLWISVPVILLATGLLHDLTLQSLRRLSDDLMFTKLPASGPEIAAVLPVSSSRASSLFPFYHLRPEVRDIRPGWGRAVTVATLTAWVVFCFTSAIPKLLSTEFYDPEQMERGRSLEILLCGLIPLVCGFVRVFLCASLCWSSRLGPISRIFTGRLVVPSYDRVFQPLVLAIVIGCGTILIPADSGNMPLTVSVFLSLLLVQRGRPAVDQWQMTADARLSTALMSNPRPTRR